MIVLLIVGIRCKVLANNCIVKLSDKEYIPKPITYFFFLQLAVIVLMQGFKPSFCRHLQVRTNLLSRNTVIKFFLEERLYKCMPFQSSTPIY